MGKPVRVSDHAIVRYCERIHGVSLDFLRDEIRDLTQQAAELKATAVVRDGVRFVIQNHTIVTCYEE